MVVENSPIFGDFSESGMWLYDDNNLNLVIGNIINYYEEYNSLEEIFYWIVN